NRPHRGRGRSIPTWLKEPPKRLAVLATEADAAGTLTFGRLLVHHLENGRWVLKMECLFHRDDLAPDALTELRRSFHAGTRRLGTWREPTDALGVRAYLMPLSDFLETLYWECVKEPCTIAGWELAAQIARIARRASPAQKKDFRGGFSFELWPS